MTIFPTGDEGIEPPPKVLETPIIPFDQSPIYDNFGMFAQLNSLTLIKLTIFPTGDEGIEPPPKVLETPIIPFDQSPIYDNFGMFAQLNSLTLIKVRKPPRTKFMLPFSRIH